VGADETLLQCRWVGVYGTNVPLYTPHLGERLKPAPWLEQDLHPPTDQRLNAPAVEGLPGWFSYGEPPLPQVRRPLLDFVARENNQLERL
jgi:hypothetical protein